MRAGATSSFNNISWRNSASLQRKIKIPKPVSMAFSASIARVFLVSPCAVFPAVSLSRTAVVSRAGTNGRLTQPPNSVRRTNSPHDLRGADAFIFLVPGFVDFFIAIRAPDRRARAVDLKNARLMPSFLAHRRIKKILFISGLLSFWPAVQSRWPDAVSK